MNHPRRKLLLLLACFLLALAGAFASSLRSRSRAPINEVKSEDVKRVTRNSVAAEQQPGAAGEVIGPIAPHVIAGGGGTSTGGSIRVDGSIGEVSASNAMSGDTFTLNGGFWNALTGDCCVAIAFTDVNPYSDTDTHTNTDANAEPTGAIHIHRRRHD